jgi:hypothetical protein
MRLASCFDDYLFLLGTVPHTVTRLDVARDYLVDTPAVFKELSKLYPDDRIALSRKALKVSRTLTARAHDGKQTGTWYAGKKSKAKISLKVYDKREETLDRTGVDTGVPLTRVEFTCRKGMGVSLRDASEPLALFTHCGALCFLPAAPESPLWASHGETWGMVGIAVITSYEAYLKRLDSSPELNHIAQLAANLGPNAVEMAVRQFRTRIEQFQAEPDLVI